MAKARVVIPVSSQVIEDWSDPTFGNWMASDWSGYEKTTLAAMPDDGIMGGPFGRYSQSGNIEHKRSFFDFTQRYEQRVRIRIVAHDANWSGTMVWLASEARIYAGGYNQGGYGFIWPSNSIGVGDVVDFRQIWEPSTSSYRYQYSKNGGPLTDVVGQPFNINSWTPPALWFGCYTATFDFGKITGIGSRIFGCSDFQGFDDWDRASFVGCGVCKGMDKTGVSGGIYPGQTVTPPIQNINVKNAPYPPYNQAFSAESCVVGVPTGYRYGEMWFNGKIQAVDATGRVGKLEVFDAATGLLLPDTMVPGNSVGLVTAPNHPIHPSSLWPLKRVPLTIPDGTEFYVRFSGNTGNGSDLDPVYGGTAPQAPHLQSLYVTFSSPLSEVFAPSAPVYLSGAAPTLTRQITAPASALSLQGAAPTLAQFSSLVPLSAPSSALALQGAAPTLSVRDATRWAQMGTKFRLADGREVPFKIAVNP